MAVEIPHLFVYGTLREACGHEMHRVLAQHAVPRGRATVRGWLYSLGEYPGLTYQEDATDRVIGEVYEIRSESLAYALRLLDAYEGVGPEQPRPHEYRRDVVQATLEDGRGVRAWAYVLNHEPDRLERIRSGDFLAWRRDQRSLPART